MSEDADKSFDPTPKRREQFRKQGRFARARDAGMLASAGATVGVLVASRQAMAHAVDDLFERCFARLGERGAAIPFDSAGAALLALAAPAVLAASIGGVAAGFAQAGLQLRTELLFKSDRLNPMGRLKQLFSLKNGAAEAGLAISRVAAMGYVAYRLVLSELPSLLSLGSLPLRDSTTILVTAISRVALGVLVTLLVMGAVDYAYSRFTLEREMRMTRKEIMDEQKSEEGDPKQKGKMRSRARALAKKRAIANVKKSAVVVTNPTHVSVALRYDENDVAPIVVAKGHDDLAMRIRVEARKWGVPILENRALARALDAEVPLGHPVPAAHFVAVARVLAFVMRLGHRSRQARHVLRPGA